MIQPLSARKYLWNNLKRSSSMLVAIAMSVLLIMVFQMVFYAVSESGRMARLGTYEHMSVVYPGEQGRISDTILTKIRSGGQVDRAVPMLVDITDYYHFFGNLNIPVYTIDDGDLPYALDRLRLKLTEGRLPMNGKEEILLDERTARNKGLRIGDEVGRAVDPTERLPGKYRLVGLVEGECLIGFGAREKDTLSETNGLLLYGDDMEAVNALLAGTPKEDARVLTKETGEKAYAEDEQMMGTVSSIIVGVVIFIMSFAAANLSYAQYFARRYEFGTLQALGYRRSSILLKGAREILVLNLLGFALGIGLLLAAAALLHGLIFAPKGYPFVLLEAQSLFKTMVLPAFTVVFSLIPAWWILSKVDPLTVVEQFE